MITADFATKPGQQDIGDPQLTDIRIQTETVRVEWGLPQLDRARLVALGTAPGFAATPIGLSCRLHVGAGTNLLTLADFTPQAFAIADPTTGLERGFRQWTLRATCKTVPGLALKLHVVARRGERCLRLEPELVNTSAADMTFSDLRFHLDLPDARDVQAELIGGRPEYLLKIEGAQYVLPALSHAWRGAVGDLAVSVPPNCGHLVLTKGDDVLAAWYPAGHGTAGGGRSSYVHLPITAQANGLGVQLSWPFYAPFHGTDASAVLPLKAGLSHRPFGMILAAGKAEHGDPWAVIRRARADAMTRGGRGPRPLPRVGWGTWLWPTDFGPERYTKAEWSYLVRQPPQGDPRTVLGDEGCREWYVKSSYPQAKDLGCEMVWFDLMPIHMGTFVAVAERFPSGFKRLRNELKRAGLSANCILIQDCLGFGQWNDALEARFGACHHAARPKEYMCWASPWAAYATDKLARVVKDYELGSAQISFNNNLLHPIEACDASNHGHVPCRDGATDYARKTIESYNDLYAGIFRRSPSTFLLENVPTVYDLGNPLPDAMWVNDCDHMPQMMWILLDYMSAQRRLWPMEMRFQNYLTTNYEPGNRSTHLVANIALGNAMSIGMDFRFVRAELRAFFTTWINFYRVHREWLCGNIRILDRHTIGHTLPNQFLVFLFNEEETPRDMTVAFRPDEQGLADAPLEVVEDTAGAWRHLGAAPVAQGQVTWTQRVAGLDFTVLRFCAATDDVTPIASTAISSNAPMQKGRLTVDYQPLSGAMPVRACYFARTPPVWVKANDIPVPFVCTSNGLVTVDLPREPCRVTLASRPADASLTRRAGVTVTASSVEQLPYSPSQHSAEGVVDGRYGRQGDWKANEQDRGWVKIDLQREQPVSEVVWSRDRNGLFPDCIPADYRIGVSRDGKSWKTVVNVKNNTAGAGVRHAFRPVACRYVRFSITRTCDHTAPTVDEIEVF